MTVIVKLCWTETLSIGNRYCENGSVWIDISISTSEKKKVCSVKFVLHLQKIVV